MATTAIWDVRDNLSRVLRYVLNDDKTEFQLYATGVGCTAAMAEKQMQLTKQRFGKEDGILAFHGYQSFAKGETTPEVAHAIGLKLATELWGDRFEVLVTTHVDRDHLHSHFVINSVSYVDGKKLHISPFTYLKIREVSDRLCAEHSLSVIKNPKGRGTHYAEWQAEQQGRPSWRQHIRTDIDKAISVSLTYTRFIKVLQEQGYEVAMRGKYMTLKPPGKARPVRLRADTLGERYTPEGIQARIRAQGFDVKSPARPRHITRRYRGIWPVQRRLTGIRALYYRYLYLLGIIGKNQGPGHHSRGQYFYFRADVDKARSLSRQARLLSREKLDAIEEVEAHAVKLTGQIGILTAERESVRGLIRRCTDDTLSQVYEARAGEITHKLRGLRQDLRDCQAVRLRSEKLQAKLKEAIQHDKEREERHHESRSHGRRPGHPIGAQIP